MPEIEIKDCNSISQAKVLIESGKLNIKYGANGTGKSTIGRAIWLNSLEDKERLRVLTPYPNDGTRAPEVIGSPYRTVCFFDESYINNYIFQGQSLMNDTFKVFLKDDKCEEFKRKISEMLMELHSVFQSDMKLVSLKEFLPKYLDTVKYSGNTISRKGGVGELIHGNGAGFEKYSELNKYKSYYDRDATEVASWGEWRNQGINQMHGNTCPFCAESLCAEITRQNEIIGKVFKKSALTVANKILMFLEEGTEKGYIQKDSFSDLKHYINVSGHEDALENELVLIHDEVIYLFDQLKRIQGFKPMVVSQDQIGEIEQSLEQLCFDESKIVKFFKTDLILNMIRTVNEKVDELKTNTGELKGLFLQHERKMNLLISERKNDINEFFQLAGFPYKFEIKVEGENRASSYLVPNNITDYPIPKPGEHLSWGEKNAFSLVMFMFDALSMDADLIILDDPITSFDKDKKFAVIRRLFDKKRASFKGKTVLMVTHDLQPLIDYVYNEMLTPRGQPECVNACYIFNENGFIKEQSVVKTDLLNTVELTRTIANDSASSMPVRIVNFRKYTELTQPDYRNSSAYEVASNLIHGRVTPTLGDGETPLDSTILQDGLDEINVFIRDKQYNELLEEMSTPRLFSLLNTAEQYEKIIIIRLLFERGDGLLSDLRKECPAACKFVNESNHVENDYIFQLNPYKFFSIPDLYCKQLEDFLVRNSTRIH